MTDCPNAEIRDRLPDLLHERLDASTRAMVEAHVAGCADCRAELELLRAVQSSLIARTPRVDVGAIVAALPKPPARARMTTAAAPRRHRTWVDWRVAAAVTVLAVGAGSYTIVRQQYGGETVAVRTPVEAPTRPSAPGGGQPIVNANPTPPVTPTPEPRSRGTAPDASPNQPVVVADAGAEAEHVSNLSRRQLKTLLDDIDKMPAIPLTDVEPASIKIDVKANTPSLPERM